MDRHGLQPRDDEYDHRTQTRPCHRQANRCAAAIKRNHARFPQDFMFQLSADEFTALRSQTVTSNTGRGGRR
ncbi:MAG TPA: hypothetical protein DCP03_15485 [Polaromonas sp.]|uniref:ORF6N domain-containing protein n=1 Tax=Polaromonas sp. UBA4122 TaxID=1947074 RepID=UPI000ED44C72|nr:ORF6N domain-containing protein [Polaromonas sp. UBA4122]HAL39430.1 hypothetical protein [Polaromonas sp.]